MPKLPFSLPDIVKYPLHVVVYLMLAYFCYKEFTPKKDDCGDLRAIVTTQGKRIETLENKNDNLTYSIAVKSGLIDKLKSQKDSTARGNNENIK